MSILTNIENYLSQRPDEDIFELMYALGQLNRIVLDWKEDNIFNIEDELKIVDQTIDESFKDNEWFKQKEGRYENFLKYIHEHMLAYYDSIKEKK